MGAQGRGLPPTRRLAAVLLTVGPLVAAWCPRAAVSEAAVSDPVLVAAGDIACDPADPHFAEDGGNYCEQNLTADLVESQNPSMVAAVGDLQYESGTLSAFQASYDPTWGRFKGITRPSVGNHEYMTVNAQGYRDYWANRGGADLAYAYNLGTWRIYVLNSNCAELASSASRAPCTPRPTGWRRDQAANPRKCVLAYWHMRSAPPRRSTRRIRPSARSGRPSATTGRMWWSMVTGTSPRSGRSSTCTAPARPEASRRSRRARAAGASTRWRRSTTGSKAPSGSTTRLLCCAWNFIRGATATGS